MSPDQNDAADIRHRWAGPGDIPGLVALLTEIMEHHGVPPPPGERLRRTLAGILRSEHHRFLVAEGPEGLVGTCALIFVRSTWAADAACELQDVVVAQGSRGRGLGRGLVEAAMELARREGCRRLYLTAEVWNLGAHAFYRELGFEEKACLYFEKGL